MTGTKEGKAGSTLDAFLAEEGVLEEATAHGKETAMDDSLIFIVEGSQGDEYKVTFKKINGHLIVTCTCQAADNGLQCKHRIALLNRDVDSIISENEGQVSRITEMLAGTSLNNALTKYNSTEADLDKAKREFSKAKKTLARAMINGGSING